jgi:hypothetical protein
VSAWIPDDPTYSNPALAPLPTSLDSVARGVSSSYSLDAMRHAAGPHRDVHPARLSVTATPNTRVLHVTYAAADPRSARLLAFAAASAMLRLHAMNLRAERQQVIATLTARRDALSAAATDVADVAQRAGQPLAVRTELAGLRAQLRDAGVELSAAEQLTIEPGRVLQPTSVAANRDRQLLDAANALALGVLAVAGLLLLLGARNPRVASLSGAVDGLPLIWRGGRSALDPRDLVHRYRPGTAVAVGTDRQALQAAADLDAAIRVDDRDSRGLIVTVGLAQRLREVRLALSRLPDAQVIGIVAVTADTPREVRDG